MKLYSIALLLLVSVLISCKKEVETKESVDVNEKKEGKNAFVSNGTLKIVVKKEGEGQKVGDYTSSRILSKLPFKYGRMEIRAKMPDYKGKGLWPAITGFCIANDTYCCK